jgi:threonine/homoserine/homoserine lactone efflux protein
MPDTPRLLAFIGAGLLLNLTPGVDVFYVLTSALRRGARAGVVAAFGITAGCCVHIGAAAVGLSALVAASATAFTVLKWVGAAYLVYMGLAMMLSRGTAADGKGLAMAGAFSAKPAANGRPGEAKDAGDSSSWRVFRRGFLTNTLNPKVALFFLAFVPQFIASDAPHPTLAFLALGLLFNFNALWVNIGWAQAAAWMARRAQGASALSTGRTLRWIERAAGLLIVAFGLKLAFTDGPSSVR